MATGDLYIVRVDVSTNNRPWGINFYLEEVDPISAGGDGITVAEAVQATIVTELTAALSRDSQVERIVASKRFVGINPTGRIHLGDVDGGRLSDSLPNDNCWRLQFVQIAAAAKHNGGVNISGIGIADHDQSRLEPAFAVGAAKTLADAFIANYDAVGPATGRWRLVVLTNVAPFSHGIGSAFVVTSVRVNSTILTQSSRRQKVPGFAT